MILLLLIQLLKGRSRESALLILFSNFDLSGRMRASGGELFCIKTFADCKQSAMRVFFENIGSAKNFA